MPNIEIEMPLFLNDRGNTLLVRNESMVGWLEVKRNVYLEVAWNPDNYPALNVTMIERTPEEIVEHINKNLTGWFVRKANFNGIRRDVNGIVE
jgi:phage-related protein